MGAGLCFFLHHYRFLVVACTKKDANGDSHSHLILMQ